jgi:hypothetical protein
VRISSLPRARLGAEQVVGLVEQGHVVVGEHDVGHRRRARSVQQLELVVGEVLAAGEAEQSARPEQVVEQLARGQHRPHPLQRLDDRRRLAYLRPQLGRLDRDAGRLGQRPGDLALDEAATGVVGAEPAAGVADDVLGLADGEAEVLEAVGQAQRRPERTSAVSHRLGQHRRHLLVALDPPDGGAVAALDVDPVDQVGEHGQLDPGLTERRQHLLDVGEEQPVRSDDQHALVLQREPVRVEQVGGAVEGDHGLAGAGSALDDEHAGQRGPDDLVLLALDGGDDVAEAARACGLERRDQRALPLQAGAFAEVEGVLAEELVFDAEQLTAAGGEVAAAGQAHRLAAGGPVEGLGDRGPPVDDERFLVGARHGDATDVERLAVGELLVGLAVDAAEHERGVAQVKLGQAVRDGVVDDLTLEAGLLGAALPDLDHALQPVGRGPRCFQGLVGAVDELLLGGQIWMHGHGASAVLGGGSTPKSGIRQPSRRR